MSTDRIKDPNAVLDFPFSWAAWLADGETISSFDIVAEDGLTVDSSAESSGVVTPWVSGGTDGQNYSLTCRITTSAGRTDDRTMTIRVRER